MLTTGLGAGAHEAGQRRRIGTVLDQGAAAMAVETWRLRRRRAA